MVFLTCRQSCSLAKKPSTEPGKNNYRMCADYKDVNANTKPRGCSIPNI